MSGALPNRISSDLPDHKVGFLGDDVGIEPLKLSRRFLAAMPSVDHCESMLFGYCRPQEACQPRPDRAMTESASPAVVDEPIATILACRPA